MYCIATWKFRKVHEILLYFSLKIPHPTSTCTSIRVYTHYSCSTRELLTKKNFARQWFIPHDALLARYVLSSWVCPSVCSLLTRIVSIRLNCVWSRKQRHTIVQDYARNLGEIRTGSPPSPYRGTKCRWVGNRRFKNRRLSTNNSL